MSETEVGETGGLGGASEGLTLLIVVLGSPGRHASSVRAVERCRRERTFLSLLNPSSTSTTSTSSSLAQITLGNREGLCTLMTSRSADVGAAVAVLAGPCLFLFFLPFSTFSYDSMDPSGLLTTLQRTELAA